MAGACCKCPVTLSVFKRSLSVGPRGCGSPPRPLLQVRRLRERGLQEAARPCSALRPAGFHRQTALLCLPCQDSMSQTLRTCYVYLNQTSRSFAAVIQALDGELRWVWRRVCYMHGWTEMSTLLLNLCCKTAFVHVFIVLKDFFLSIAFWNPFQNSEISKFSIRPLQE